MQPRFYFSEPSPADKLLASADNLEIKFHRLNGHVCASYELRGECGNPFTDEDDGDTLPESADVTAFVLGLLAAFRSAKGGA
jgi:hypothetical protein